MTTADYKRAKDELRAVRVDFTWIRHYTEARRMRPATYYTNRLLRSIMPKRSIADSHSRAVEYATAQTLADFTFNNA